MILGGLRGVGKTVLLNKLRGMARHHEWLEVKLEARPGVAGSIDTRKTLARELQVAARRYTTSSHVGDKFKQMLRTLTSFSLSLGTEGISLGVEADLTRACTGQIEIDLRDLTEDLARAMHSLRKGLVIFIDEMQNLDNELLSALVTAQHHIGQEELPFYVVGAGLPNLPSRLAEARSYAERLFDYRIIGTLDQEEAIDSFQIPAARAGQEYSKDALDILLKVSGRYPYFIQEFGSAMWEAAQASDFTAADAEIASEIGLQRLDSGVFPSRWDRATPKERQYLTAITQDGENGSSSSSVAARLGTTGQNLGPTPCAVDRKRARIRPRPRSDRIHSPRHERLYRPTTFFRSASFARHEHIRIHPKGIDSIFHNLRNQRIPWWSERCARAYLRRFGLRRPEVSDPRIRNPVPAHKIMSLVSEQATSPTIALVDEFQYPYFPWVRGI